MKIKYTREELIKLCEKSLVLQKDWEDRDSSDAQIQISKALILLKAGCEFQILNENNNEYFYTTDNTIWVTIIWKGFKYFENYIEGDNNEEVFFDKDTFYIPTKNRLDKSKNIDWVRVK